MKNIIEEYGGAAMATIFSLTVAGYFVGILEYVTGF